MYICLYFLIFFIDGAPNNTGCWNGSHQFIEKALKRPLTWLICLFHMAELPIKHLIQYFDGHSTAPNRISNGPLGKGLYSLDNGQSPFVRIKKIRSPDLPAVGPDFFVGQDDLKTAYNFGKGIHSGNIPEYLENKPPVKIHPARSS